MKRFMKKISIMLILCMFFSISGVEVFASDTVKDTSGQIQEDLEQIPEKSKLQTSEDVSEEVVEEVEQNTDSQIQESEENNVSTETETAEGQQIEYLYLDKQILKKAEEQNVVVAFTDEQLRMESATLLYEAVGSQEQFESQADNMIDNTVLFAESYENFVSGESYRLLGVRYVVQGNVYETRFLENEAAEFEVTDQESDSADVSEVVPEVTAYTMDDNGTIIEESGDNVEEAVENVMDQAAIPIVTEAGARTRTGKTDELVVALDPGHDSHCGGAHANGLAEEVLTLKVANYCKEELEKYSGVKVLMTRTTAECPNPLPGSYSSAKDIRKRVQKAVEQGADVIVSFHFNSSGSSGANGAEVIYQNQSYNAEVGLESKELAQKIQDQLKALGLKDRGIYSKDSTDGSHDPNGIKDDYWSLHNEAKALNTPAVLIEHAFLTGNVDAANLKSEAYLKKLGIADAQGIVNRYGLSKEAEIPKVSEVKVVNQNDATGTFQVLISGVTPLSNVSEIRVPIWSDENGQDDLKWYTAINKGNGNFVVDVDIKNHKNNYGSYIIHVYVKDKSNVERPVWATSTILEKVDLKIKLEMVDPNKGIFNVIASPTEKTAGIKEIRIPVWSKIDQSDIYWYTAKKQADGSFKAQVDKKNHKNSAGIYNVHVYITTDSGKTMSIIGGTIEIPMPEMLLKVIDTTNTQKNFRAQLTNVGNIGIVNQVRFAVWSIEAGQDDLVWYTGKQNTSGIWEANIDILNHKTAGEYYIDAYAKLADGTEKYLKTSKFKVDAPRIGKIEIVDVNISKGIFDVIIHGVDSPAGIDNVKVPVWCAADQSDIYWYSAQRQADGTYAVRVDKKNHKNATGIYNIHVYAESGNGITISVIGGSKSIEVSPMILKAQSKDKTEMQYELSISNVGNLGDIAKVKFAVWSIESGQDDLRWYNAIQNSSGVWCSEINIIDHKTYGSYYVDAYGYTQGGIEKYLKTTTFKVTEPTISSTTFKDVDASKGIFDIIINGIISPSGVVSVRVPVWSKADQSDIVWYDAKLKNDGTYIVRVDKKNHKDSTGVYIAHIYVTTGNGITISRLGGTKTVEQGKINYTALKTDNKDKEVLLSLSNASYAGDIRQVKYAVWSVSNGQDDLRWYDAVQDSTGAWKYKVLVSNHKTAGDYYADAYGYLINGQKIYLGTEKFSIEDITIGKISVSEVDPVTGVYEVNIDGVSSKSDIVSVKVAVWSKADRSDLKWIVGTKQPDGKYKSLVSPALFGFNSGTYFIHVYVEADNGVQKSVDVGRREIPTVMPTPIMEISDVTARQLARLYNSTGNKYPSVELAKGGAETLEKFCEIYVEEAKAEGVKVEVAFSQAMLETGWLKFGGIVKIEQFNFCGLGATDINGAVNSAWFKDVREGVRAQIQHLKAYASTEGLNNPCVDPRFSYVSRGVSPYVETLGIQENPEGKGWATQAGYGYNILGVMNKIK